MGATKELYAEAIELVVGQKNDSVDDKLLLIEILKINPAIITEAHYNLNNPPLPQREFLANVSRIFNTQGKIPAIKYYRGVTKEGLKDSKDAVESICE